MKKGQSIASRRVWVGATLCALLASPSAWAVQVDAAHRGKKKAQPNQSTTGDSTSKKGGHKRAAPMAAESTVIVIVAADVGKSAGGKAQVSSLSDALSTVSQLVASCDWSIAVPAAHATGAPRHRPVYQALAPPAVAW